MIFCRPSRAWIFCVNPRRRSLARFALSYHCAGFQPFRSVKISVHQRLKIFAVFGFLCGQRFGITGRRALQRKQIFRTQSWKSAAPLTILISTRMK